MYTAETLYPFIHEIVKYSYCILQFIWLVNEQDETEIKLYSSLQFRINQPKIKQKLTDLI